MRSLLMILLLACTNAVFAYHPNDQCETALSLSIPSFGTINTAGASSDVTPVCSPATPANGVWLTVVGNGTTLQFSTCDNDGGDEHAVQVYKGDCGNLVCVGGNDATFCHINTSSTDARWCAELGVTYFIHLGAETSGPVIAYYSLISLGACNYIGGNCVPEIVHAPVSFAATTDNRDDCCEFDAADQHFLVHIPYDGEWKFIVCNATPHLYIGNSFCAYDICWQSDNIQEPLPECNHGSVCGCMTLAEGDYHVAVEMQMDDGEGSNYTFMALSCNPLNVAPPIVVSSEIHARCASIGATQTRTIIVDGPDLDPARPPIVQLQSDCGDSCNIVAGPATFSYDPNGWVFHPGSPNVPGQTLPHWRNTVYGVTTGMLCVLFEGFLPVDLLNFSAVAADQEVHLLWSTASEEELDKFVIERDGIEIASVSATNSSSGESYAYVDRELVNGTPYHYALFALHLNGEREHLANAEATPEPNNAIIGGFALEQNYPNPFNPETTIEYSIHETGLVRLAVFDLNGREVMTLVNGTQNDGAHSVNFDAASLSSGIYFYQLEHNGLALTKKMMLLK